MTATADVWGGASYERIAATFAPIHERVVAELDPRPGEAFLDLACGTGGVALRAAERDAEVVGLDISRDQLEKARRAASAAGFAIRFDEDDCQALPYPDASFAAAASVFGMIFAADHARAAAELARVSRPAARMALTAWPEDDWTRFNQRVGRAMNEGAQRWAQESHVRSLLGEAFELRFEEGEWTVTARSPEALWEFFASSAPPLKAWLATLGEDRREEVDAAFLEYFASGELRREYLLVLGRRR